MPMLCTVCLNQKRREIEGALLERRPLRHIAKLFGTSTGSLQRHRAHLSAAVVKAQAAQEVIREVAAPATLLTDVRAAEGRAERLYASAEEILSRAMEAKDLPTALKAIAAGVSVMAEARSYMAMRGELTGELNDRGQVPQALQSLNILMMPVVTQAKPEPTHIVDAELAGARLFVVHLGRRKTSTCHRAAAATCFTSRQGPRRSGCQALPFPQSSPRARRRPWHC